MSEHNSLAGWLQERETIVRENPIDGIDDDLKIQDITQTELDELEDRAEEGPDAEAAAIREALLEYLVHPFVVEDPSAADPDDGVVHIDSIPMNKRSQLWFHMQMAWSGAEEVQGAMEEMDLPQGNR